jgi:HD-GYP domain-containing protein (c-di-GMP phosphodiesterase class II)
MLLLDVGKLRTPSAILNKTDLLTREEFEVVKQHVNLGVKMLKSTLGINRSIISMVETHHERYDGSGYPNGLSGQQIPLYGVIAGIIDTYTSMIRSRPHRPAISPHKVLQALYNWRNKFFQDEIVQQFLQCVGVYPTGSLVEMSTGEVGIVIAQNLHDRLEPTICMLLDENKGSWASNKNRTDANGRRRRIAHALEDGAYGISAVERQEILAKKNI